MMRHDFAHGAEARNTGRAGSAISAAYFISPCQLTFSFTKMAAFPRAVGLDAPRHIYRPHEYRQAPSGAEYLIAARRSRARAELLKSAGDGAQ